MRILLIENDILIIRINGFFILSGTDFLNMNARLTELLSSIKEETKTFKDVIAHIEGIYEHKPTAFKNGETHNAADQNQGSAKVFSFAQLNNLSKADTLLLFAEHYQSVLDHPTASDHQNIRQFMANGWDGIVFEGNVLTAK